MNKAQIDQDRAPERIAVGALQPPSELRPLDKAQAQTEDLVCCGPPPSPVSSPLERAGYRICPYVRRFVDTPAGPVPNVGTRLGLRDRLGTIAARTSGVREGYRVAPGLYCAGEPGPEDVVLVTANYKMSFDALRKELGGLNAWILVLDTRGINVWCAAGKGTFSAAEVTRQVRRTGLDRVVRHRRLILPQLSGPGVSARDVKRQCGFEVVWGPVRARDLRGFLLAGMTAERSMRRVTFTLGERAVLVPIEIWLVRKSALWVLAAAFLLSGIGPGVFSMTTAWHKGLAAGLGILGAFLGGAIAAPVLLPWLPGKAFAVKGAVSGVVAGFIALALGGADLTLLGGLGLLLIMTAISSYFTMNFTGSTPFTSPTGVEKEMRAAIPVQAGALLLGTIIWVGGSFLSR